MRRSLYTKGLRYPVWNCYNPMENWLKLHVWTSSVRSGCSSPVKSYSLICIDVVFSYTNHFFNRWGDNLCSAIVEKNSMKCYDRIRYNKRNCIVLYIIFVRKLRILKFDDSVIKILCYFLHKFCMQMRWLQWKENIKGLREEGTLYQLLEFSD